MAVQQTHQARAHEGQVRRGVILADLGVQDYDETYRLQRTYVERAKAGALGYDQLIFVEHPDVYTLGRRSSTDQADQVFPSVAVERGGEITFHTPGQLVTYPILTLEGPERDLHAYLRQLAE